MPQEHKVKVVYKKLQKRLDKYPVGAPASPQLYELLSLMFTPEEADFAARMPMIPAPLDVIAKRTGKSRAELPALLDAMASKGLIMDFPDQNAEKTFYMLSPTVVGFFEFSMMRERDDINQKRIAELMDNSLDKEEDFVRDIFQARTQLGRVVVHGSALTPEARSRVLDWEDAEAIIEGASPLSVAKCYCRHKSRLAGHPCDKPEDICMGIGADYLIRQGLAREVEKAEMLDLLEQAREAGLVHIADNVRTGVGFICNCCGCHCGMLRSMNEHGLSFAVHTSGFVAQSDPELCNGCGKCAKRCPVNAISIRTQFSEERKKVKRASIDTNACIGCGVCLRACDKDALSMKHVGRRTLTPESTLEHLLTMAIERGKVHHFLFDGADGPTAGFLKNLTGAVLNMPGTKRLLLNKELKSRYMEFIAKNAPGG